MQYFWDHTVYFCRGILAIYLDSLHAVIETKRKFLENKVTHDKS